MPPRDDEDEVERDDEEEEEESGDEDEREKLVDEDIDLLSHPQMIRRLKREVVMWKCLALLSTKSREDLDPLLVAIGLGIVNGHAASPRQLEQLRARAAEHVEKTLGEAAGRAFRKIVLEKR